MPGGRDNHALEDHTFAAGHGAKAEATGAFVWGDGSSQGVTSTVTNEFKVQAGGGAVIYSKSDLSTGVALGQGDTSWSNASTRKIKTDVEPVDPADVLSEVEQLPISTWTPEGAPDVRHMGPMAEDFHDAFGLGIDEEHINTVDADGVALAAIQGLAEQLAVAREQLDEKDDRIDRLEAENDRKTERIDRLETETERLRDRLAALESSVASGGTEVPSDD